MILNSRYTRKYKGFELFFCQVGPDLTRGLLNCVRFGQIFSKLAPTRPAPLFWQGGFGHFF
jgi:hypothetical protein